jgi:Mrp family chromosome partitioning ATPase/capsular polysaccharide biosynthesis protein
MPDHNNQGDSIDFAQAIRILRRRLPLVVLCVVVVAAAAFAYSKSQPSEYTATASLVFDSGGLSQQVAGLAPATTVNQITKQASNIELVRLGDMAAKTAAKLGNGLTRANVEKKVSVSGQGESSVVGISATSTSPALSAAIANTYGRQFVKEQQKANKKFFRHALSLVQKQLEQLPQEQQFGQAAVALQNRAQTLQLLSNLGYGEVEVAQAASVPTYPSAPTTSKNTLIGGFFGLVIGACLAFALERFERERRLRDGDDLESTYLLPLFGGVPESDAVARTGGTDGKAPAPLSPQEEEAFNMIRARMRLTEGSEPQAVLVTAAASGDGTTTVAWRLAEAAARLGARTLLVEADLRNPALADRLDLPAGPGIQEALNGTAPVAGAIRRLRRNGATGNGPALDVLACGPMPAFNPGELFEGAGMDAVLAYAKSHYEFTLIEAPPLTEISDGLSLLGRVDGVVVVSWLGRSRRDRATQLRETLARGSARQLGVIANRIRPTSSRSHRFGRHRVKAEESRQFDLVPRPPDGKAPARTVPPIADPGAAPR